MGFLDRAPGRRVRLKKMKRRKVARIAGKICPSTVIQLGGFSHQSTVFQGSGHFLRTWSCGSLDLPSPSDLHIRKCDVVTVEIGEAV